VAKVTDEITILIVQGVKNIAKKGLSVFLAVLMVLAVNFGTVTTLRQ